MSREVGSRRDATGSCWRAVVWPYLLTRVGVLVLGSLALQIYPLIPLERQWRFLPEHLWLDGLVRWDSGWYRSIIARGYFVENRRDENVHFLPVYPLIVAGVMKAVPSHIDRDKAFAYSAIFVSHVAFYVGLAGVFELARAKLDLATALRCTWLVCLFPYAFFFSAAYTESTYLALAAWAFVHAERGRIAYASLLAAVAGATRIPGVFVGMSVALVYLRRLDYRVTRLTREAWWLLLAPMGCLVFAAYIGLKFSDPLVLLHVSAQSPSHYNGGVWAHLVHTFNRPWSLNSAIERMTLAGSIVIVVLVFALSAVAKRRLGLAYAAFPILSMLFASLYTLDANGRYAAVLFPVFIIGALMLSRAGFVLISFCGAISGALLFSLFAHWKHIT